MLFVNSSFGPMSVDDNWWPIAQALAAKPPTPKPRAKLPC